ncbi:unnamed protein product [Ilex paraguariensis]|uniref:CBS domain-containing protein n=1 Tax=Ilex paraguariensis TaxID=185542 RepID=A0ABC8SV93_9AQUA
MPGRSNMDVDNDPILRQEAVPRISQADIELSRHRISVFLSTHTAYELLPDSGKVIALDVNLPVKQAFHILYEQGIPVAPLWDFCKGRFVGVLSALDFILILRELGNHGSNLTEEELETHTISAWKEVKLHLSRQIDGNARSYSRHLVHMVKHRRMMERMMVLLFIPLLSLQSDPATEHWSFIVFQFLIKNPTPISSNPLPTLSVFKLASNPQKMFLFKVFRNISYIKPSKVEGQATLEDGFYQEFCGIELLWNHFLPQTLHATSNF